MKKKIIAKKLLAESMEQLLTSNKIEDITVGDIIFHADISRTTFYRYFDDKYALVNWIYAQYMDDLTEKYQHITCYQWLMYDLTEFLQSKKDFYKKIIGYVGQNSFNDYFLNSTKEFLSSNLKQIRKTKQLSREDEYLVLYNSSGTVHIIYDWLFHGCKEEPKQLVAIITTSMSAELRKYFVIHPDYDYEPPR